MIPIDGISALLLAAGLSRRFGPGDKLLAPFRGRPLVGHAASLIASLPFARRFAVLPEGDGVLPALLAGSGFELIRNPVPERGREHSLRLGLAAALDAGAEAVMVFLGDMPNLEAQHVEALAGAASAHQAAISANGAARLPPLLIPKSLARSALEQQGLPVKAMLGDAAAVPGSPERLRDYDTAAEIEQDGLGAEA